MLGRWIHKNRQKSKAARERTALTGAGIVTGLVLLGWLYTVPGHFGTLTPNQETTDSAAFTSFFNELQSQVAGVREAVGNTTTTASTSSSSVIYNQPDTTESGTQPIRIATTSEASTTPVNQ